MTAALTASAWRERVDGADWARVAAEARAFLSARGVDLSGEQETKTRKALEYFSRELKTKAQK